MAIFNIPNNPLQGPAGPSGPVGEAGVRGERVRPFYTFKFYRIGSKNIDKYITESTLLGNGHKCQTEICILLSLISRACT